MDNPYFSPCGEWERSALVELYNEYAHVVRDRRLRLRPAAIELTDATSFWGKWEPATRTIYLSRKLLSEHNWFQVIAVLRHEMAHQMVDELEAPRGRSSKPHGDPFQNACRKLGLPSEFAGAGAHLRQDPLDWRESPRDEATERLLEKVRKLLNLATSTNEHEALLAMNRVREIYARYNLEKTVAEKTAEFRHLIISTGRKRLQTVEQKVVGILVGHFFVQVIVGREYNVKVGEHHRVIEIIGTRENIMMAEYVYHFLIEQSRKLTLDAAKISKMTLSSRRSFHMGILQGFDDKLQSPPSVAASPRSTSPGAELAPQVGEASPSVISQAVTAFRDDKCLDEYISMVYPRLTRLTSQARLHDGCAFAAGKKVGRELTLNKPIHSASQGPIRFLKSWMGSRDS